MTTTGGQAANAPISFSLFYSIRICHFPCLLFHEEMLKRRSLSLTHVTAGEREMQAQRDRQSPHIGKKTCRTFCIRKKERLFVMASDPPKLSSPLSHFFSFMPCVFSNPTVQLVRKKRENISFQAFAHKRSEKNCLTPRTFVGCPHPPPSHF